LLNSAALTSGLVWGVHISFCGAPHDNLANAQGERSTPMSISTRLKSFLDETQIPYSVMTHTTAYTAQGAAATMQISGKELAKTVVLWTGEEMILAVLPAPNQVRLDKLAADEAIVFNAGTHRDAIRIRYDDFVRLAKPRVCSFAQKG
jgi:prolyl-tRNA editing enzyme YbaK/EbsC (Cys-tRNA(Pro) deacylase)